MAAKEDGETASQRPKDHRHRSAGCLQRNWQRKVGALAKGGKHGRNNPWQKSSGKKGGKGQEEGGKERTKTCWTCGKTRHIAAWCRKGGNKNLYAFGEDGSEAEESVENEEDLQAWCMLEESENEQWQEVISRRSKQRAKKVNQASLSSVECSQQFESEEDYGDERQVGESQSHHGLWSRRSCDA